MNELEIDTRGGYRHLVVIHRPLTEVLLLDHVIDLQHDSAKFNSLVTLPKKPTDPGKAFQFDFPLENWFYHTNEKCPNLPPSFIFSLLLGNT